MYPNLIYNGDFHLGTETWSAPSLSVANGEATMTGELVSSVYIPIGKNRRYKISFDLKFNTVASGKAFYGCLRPYDSRRNSIPMNKVNKPWANTETTLASDLNDGDTTVTLTSSANWTKDTYACVGICNLLAYGYNMSSYSQGFGEISGNTVTLNTAWAGGSFPAGTKVAEFRSGNTYFYPISLSTGATKPTEWTSYSYEFLGSSIRPYTSYVLFSTTGYTHNYSMRNIKLECISDYQECPISDITVKPSLLKEGIFDARQFNEIGMNVRYIRDTTNGNSVNSANHWIEVQVFNDADDNIALAQTVTINGTSHPNSYATNGVVNSQYLDGASGVKTLQLDLGHIEHINKIKIWHYYPDGRTYNDNVTEVSIDGTNWIQVYTGKKPETSAGNTINLSPMNMSIADDGQVSCKEIIEW